MAVFRRWKLPSGERTGRWVSKRTGRLVRNVTVAKQLRVPRSAIHGNESSPRRWTEVEAVYRTKAGPKGKERYVEAVRRITIKDATQRELRAARRKVRTWVKDSVRRKIGGLRLRGEQRIVVGVELRRRATRPKAGSNVEARGEGILSEPTRLTPEQRDEYLEWWEALGPDGRDEMRKYLPVGTLAWLESEYDEDGEESEEWTDANGRLHDTETGRFL